MVGNEGTPSPRPVIWMLWEIRQPCWITQWVFDKICQFWQEAGPLLAGSTDNIWATKLSWPWGSQSRAWFPSPEPSASGAGGSCPTPWWESWRTLPVQTIGESHAMLVMAAHPECGLAGISAQQHGGHSEGIATQGWSILTLPFPFRPHQLAVRLCATHLNLKSEFTHL